MRHLTKLDIAGSTVLLLFLIVAPYALPGGYYLRILMSGLIYAIWAASWDFMSGLTGRLNFGQGLSFGLAAYLAAYLNVQFHFPPVLLVPLGVIAAVLIALAIGYPTLRLRGPYFGLATFAALILAQRIILNLWKFTGAEEGISGLDVLARGRVNTYYVVAIISTVSVVALYVLSKRKIGIILRAIRGNESTCQAAGINVTYYKILSLCISSAVSAVGGVLYAHVQQHVGPDLLSMQTALGIVTMVYIGGVGSIYGGAIAAVVLTFLVELLRPLGEWRLAAYAVLLIAILFLAPRGLISTSWARIQQRLSGEGKDASPLEKARDAA